MIKRNTWFLLALLAALAGLALYLKYKPETDASDKDAASLATATPIERIFPSESEIVNLSIESREGEIVRVERTPDGWILTKPVSAKANQGAVEAAISQAAALSITARLDLAPVDIGLISPAYIITVELNNGEAVRLEVGDLTPTGTGYYARKDGGNILVINKYGLDALLDMLETPPYAETPTPSPTPTETPTPTPEASATPASETPSAPTAEPSATPVSEATPTPKP